MIYFIDKELKKRDVWVVLMPSNQFDKPFTRGIEHNPNWVLVFLGNKQKLFVDVTTPQGKKLWKGIFTGETVYPNDFCKNLIFAYHLSRSSNQKDAKKSALNFAIKAFNLYPSQTPLHEIILASR